MNISFKYVSDTRNGSSFQPLSVLVLAVFSLLYFSPPALAMPLMGAASANFAVTGKAGVTNIQKNKIRGNLRIPQNASVGGEYQFATGSVQTNTQNEQQDQVDLDIAIKDLNLSNPIVIIDPVLTFPILPVIESESGSALSQVANIESAVAAVPEPATLALLGLGLAGLGFARRRHG